MEKDNSIQKGNPHRFQSAWWVWAAADACACARADGTIRRTGYASSAWGTVRRSGCLWAAATDVVKDEVGIRGRGRGFVEVVEDGLCTGLLILLFTFSARFSVL